jgi:hypothetical protein
MVILRGSEALDKVDKKTGSVFRTGSFIEMRILLQLWHPS